jgi:prepilin-type N-terminal cleavage/methylation domain-containing protein
MRHTRSQAAKQGFTLIEVLAALAIAAVIILATVGLMHNVVLAFDRGTNRVSGADRLVLAADRLASDIGSARFIEESGAGGGFAAFSGEPTKVTFIGAAVIDPAGRMGGGPGLVPDEVVSLSVERADDVTRIVRRRALWLGPRMRLDDALPGDPVVLVEGRFDAAFAFARMTPKGAITWTSTWTHQKLLPRLVKLALKERASGVDLLGGAEFAIRATAPISCGRSGMGAGCVNGASEARPDPTKPAPSPRTTQ